MWYNQNNQGFALVESMVAFIIFSLMLMLYLPAYHRELQRLEELKLVANQWQLFDDLIQMSQQQPSLDVDTRIEAYTLLYEEGVTWQANNGFYQIVFDGGNQYEVQLLNLQ